ncbi:Tm-1-like ATP-binding domain-containing protein [Paenibacillus luteus]|uniref:Tm-1-like ATP-binding domain-containing protein n=1 Tax=Paenibacillus luteus TaxID=2545753 RepID=UPI0011414C04|nr:Tm-1-like ATP-binding domain-containing protein [Paenibacillus luteus]
MEPVKKLLLIGSFDTKGKDYAFVKEQIELRGHQVVTMDIGVIGNPEQIHPTWPSELVAEWAGVTLQQLRTQGDRGYALSIMALGATKIVCELYKEKKIDGVLGMGGTGGTSVIATIMRTLPIGFPKVLVTTAASGDTRHIVGTKDIVLIPSIVDVAGVNRISRKMYSQAAGAVCGMAEQHVAEFNADKPIIAITMFGNTTQCVQQSMKLLDEQGYECLIFHCTGTGGRTMESLVSDGNIAAVLDITTTEWADELCGGVFTAGCSRLEAPGLAGIPHVIVPGCIDMVNFGPFETVPKVYKDRNLNAWNSDVTLMRTNVDENKQLGQIFAEKANKANGPVAIVVPTKGYSILGENGQRFHDAEADAAFVNSLKEHIKPSIEYEELACNINDYAFSHFVVKKLLQLLKKKEGLNS